MVQTKTIKARQKEIQQLWGQKLMLKTVRDDLTTAGLLVRPHVQNKIVDIDRRLTLLYKRQTRDATTTLHYTTEKEDALTAKVNHDVEDFPPPATFASLQCPPPSFGGGSQKDRPGHQHCQTSSITPTNKSSLEINKQKLTK